MTASTASLAPTVRPAPFFHTLRAACDRLAPWTHVLLRAGFGLIMVTHGLPKLMGTSHGSMANPMAGSIHLITNVLQLPAPVFFAWCVALLEGVGGLMLAAGLLTRPVAALMAVQTAAICYILGPTFPWIDRGFEYPLLMCFVALHLAVHGAGRWSADARLGREFWAGAPTMTTPDPLGAPRDAVSLNRRTFMASTASLGAATTAAGCAALPGPAPAADTSVAARLTVNGHVHALRLAPRSSLLDVLREQLDLTGAKKGCDHGQCGACTVHVNGRRVASCLTLAVKADGQSVTTIEGIAGPDGALHPVQQAFIDHDGLQCGYCTPGQVMAAIACVREGHATTDEQIREFMSGNLCRCGAYAGILAAIRDVAARMDKETGRA